MSRFVAVLALLVPALASASPAVTENPWHPGRVAFGMTTYLSSAAGGSLYIAPNEHVAVRLNAVTYKDQKLSPGAGILVAALDGGDDTDREGRIYDVGAGGMYFPRRIWDGPMLEVGVLHRERRTVRYTQAEDYFTNNSSKSGFHALAGWTWAINDQMFIATAAGAAYGYAHVWGEHIDEDFFHPSVTPFEFSRWEPTFECYLRIGAVFGDKRP